MTTSKKIITINTNWELRCSSSDAPPETREWKDVNLPCHVQASPHGIPHDEIYRGLNTDKVAWMSDSNWTFRRTIEVPDLSSDEEAVLRFKGIDYAFRIVVDSQEVLEKEGMFSHTEIPLSTGSHTIEIELFPSNYVTECHAGHNAGTIPLNETLKARFSKGWDWAPTLVTTGIWDDVELVIRPVLHIKRAWVTTTLSNSGRADCSVHVTLNKPIDEAEIVVQLDGCTRSYTVVDDNEFVLPITLSHPTLWWPNGMGVANLVDLNIELRCNDKFCDSYTTKTGLRDLRKITATGQGAEDTPHQLLVNNRPVFFRGANWVPGDSCFATMTKDRYKQQLQPYADSHFNIIRVWGGGLIEKDAFYDICDSLGLMVMQEFPLACEPVPETSKFIQKAKHEMEDFVPRLNIHPSIVIWTGGNEHFHYWDNLESGSSEMEAARKGFFMEMWDDEEMLGGVDPYKNKGLLAIGGLFEKLDGSRPYQPTSGMEGEGEPHGIWNFNPRLGDQRMHDYKNLYDFWNAADQHFYSESSVEGISHRQAIEYVLETKSPSLPHPDDLTWIHHKAFDACWPIDRDLYPERKANLWLDLDIIEELFGALTNLDDLISASQWIQAEGARYMAAELRRKIPHTCGLIWWGANEPWPNLAGNQLVDWFGTPRPALAALKEAFAPTILSLRYRHCVDNAIKPELWISNDSGQPFTGHYQVNIEVDGSEPIKLDGSLYCDDYQSIRITTLPRRRLSPGETARMNLQLFDQTQNDNCIHKSTYFFSGSGVEAPMLSHLEQMKKQYST